jgi:hypothetical protein
MGGAGSFPAVILQQYPWMVSGSPMAASSVKPETIRTDSLRALLSYWREKTRERGGVLPARRDLRPDEMVSFLRSGSLINVYDSPRRFQFRLVGTGIVASMGRETTSLWVNEAVFADRASRVSNFFSIPVETRGPAYASGRYTVSPTGRELQFETVLAPLSSDGNGVDMLLGGLVGETLQRDERIRLFDYERIHPLLLD